MTPAERAHLRDTAIAALEATRSKRALPPQALTGFEKDPRFLVLSSLHDWELQTSNSFRRIGVKGEGDGDVLCATTQRHDGHPDLHAPRGVLEYIVAAQPRVVIELLDRLDAVEAELELIAAVEVAKIAALVKESR